MNQNAEIFLSGISWSGYRDIYGAASRISERVEALANAVDEESANKAYWALDNVVVVQGRVFDVALPLIPVLLAILGGELPSFVRSRILDLLFELRYGDVHEDQPTDRAELGQKCRAAVERGLWIYWSCLLNADALVRRTALDLIADLERDIGARLLALEHGRTDDDERVRKSAEWSLEHDRAREMD